MDDDFIIPIYVVFAELCDTLLGIATPTFSNFHCRP